MNRQRFDMAVIGGGLIGLSVAVAARRRGMNVCVLEADSLGRQASSASAGGVRSLNRHPAEIALARAVLPLWHRLAGELGADCGFVASGQVRVAEDEAALKVLERRAALTRSLGYAHETMISRQAVQGRIPALAPHIVGALAVEDDGYADPLACLYAYRTCAARLGVPLFEGHRVTSVAAAGEGLLVHSSAGTVRARHGVNASGAWGGELAAAVGDKVDMTTAALQMIVTAPVAPFVTPVVGSEGRKLSLKQTGAGAVIIGGGFAGRIKGSGNGARRGVPRTRAVASSLKNATRLFPHLATARVVRSWAGLEGMTEDGLPVIGESPAMPGLIHAFGFSAHGFALVPLIGPLVAGMADGTASNLPLAPFRADRFDDAAPAFQEEGCFAHA